MLLLLLLLLVHVLVLPLTSPSLFSQLLQAVERVESNKMSAAALSRMMTPNITSEAAQEVTMMMI